MPRHIPFQHPQRRSHHLSLQAQHEHTSRDHTRPKVRNPLFTTTDYHRPGSRKISRPKTMRGIAIEALHRETTPPLPLTYAHPTPVPHHWETSLHAVSSNTTDYHRAGDGTSLSQSDTEVYPPPFATPYLDDPSSVDIIDIRASRLQHTCVRTITDLKIPGCKAVRGKGTEVCSVFGMLFWSWAIRLRRDSALWGVPRHCCFEKRGLRQVADPCFFFSSSVEKGISLFLCGMLVVVGLGSVRSLWPDI